jgi:hypothetical protein
MNARDDSVRDDSQETRGSVTHVTKRRVCMACVVVSKPCGHVFRVATCEEFSDRVTEFDSRRASMQRPEL